MIVEVTKTQGGHWVDVNDVPPPYKAIRFIQPGQFDVIWDCVIRLWRAPLRPQEPL